MNTPRVSEEEVKLYERTISFLNARCEVMRKALTWYADEKNWKCDGSWEANYSGTDASLVNLDQGEVARKALEETI